MPRYFFHAIARLREDDLEGIDLPDIEAAMRQAVTFTAVCLRGEPDKFISTGRFSVNVTDEAGALLFLVTTEMIAA